MITYIALLRGINVGGHHKIKMADLIELLNDNGFQNVTTYIQSGNIIFTSLEKSSKVLDEKISNLINQKYTYNINTIVSTAKEINHIFNSNPFLKRNQNLDISKLHVTILNTIPTKDEILRLKALSVDFKDHFEIIANIVYLHCPNGFGTTKLTNTFFEKKLKCNSTTRNWKTITKLIEISH